MQALLIGAAVASIMIGFGSAAKANVLDDASNSPHAYAVAASTVFRIHYMLRDECANGNAKACVEVRGGSWSMRNVGERFAKMDSDCVRLHGREACNAALSAKAGYDATTVERVRAYITH